MTDFLFGGMVQANTPINITSALVAANVSVTGTGLPTVGIFSPSTNQLGFATNSVQQMVIDTNGNMGIGISSPAAKLDVRTAAGTAVTQYLYTGSSAAAATLQFAQVGTVGWNTGITASSGNFQIGIDGGGLGYNINRTGLAIDYHSWLTAGAERMRIDSNGNMCLGTTGSSYSLEVRKDAVSATTYTAIRNGTAAGAYGVALLGIIGTTGNNYYQLSQSGSGDTALYNANAGNVLFGTSNTERMRIDASGNVAIGTTATTAPGGSQNFTVQSSVANAVNIIKSYANNTGAAVQARFDLATGTTNSYALINLQDNTSSPYFQFTVGPAVTANYYDSPQHIWRTVAGTERMRIDGAGNVVIGTSSSTYRLLVYDAVDRPQANAQFSITGSGYNAFHYLNATAYYIGQNSTLRDIRMYSGTAPDTGVKLTNGATSWVATSDERAKIILEPITDAANKVSTLRTVIGRLKTDESQRRRSFLIAQDVQKVFPEAVDTTDLDLLGLSYTDMIPLLTAAIKELTAKVAALEAKVGDACP